MTSSREEEEPLIELKITECGEWNTTMPSQGYWGADDLFHPVLDNDVRGIQEEVCHNVGVDPSSVIPPTTKLCTIVLLTPSVSIESKFTTELQCYASFIVSFTTASEVVDYLSSVPSNPSSSSNIYVIIAPSISSEERSFVIEAANQGGFRFFVEPPKSIFSILHSILRL